jgi:hypothetical protein
MQSQFQFQVKKGNGLLAKSRGGEIESVRVGVQERIRDENKNSNSVF